MIIIGVTGPSGAGKGVVSAYLESENIKVIDADVVYHGIITPPSLCLGELVEYFGDGILKESGELDRAALSKKVFGDENRDGLLTLNKITHKYVSEKIKELLDEYFSAQACIIDAPLLIEAELDKICDFTIAVLADKDIRAKRLVSRDGITLEAAMRRICSQKSDEFYIENTDYALYNEGDTQELYLKLDRIMLEEGVCH